MKSRASFCDSTLLKKDITRFAPLWALYTAFWMLAAFFTVQDLGGVGLEYRPSQAERLIKVLGTLGTVSSAIYAVMVAAMLLRYLHNARSAYMMHAFPLNRSTQFITHVIAGMLFFLVPQLLFTGALIIGLQLRSISLAATLGLTLLGKQCLAWICFFGLAVFCMLLTGRTIIGVLSYGAIQFIGYVLPRMVCMLLSELFLGFAYRESVLGELSPFLALVVQQSLPRLLIWAGIGVLALVAAWLHYRVRHLERAGDAMVHTWAKVAFQLLFTVTAGLGLSFILWLLFSGEPVARYPFVFLLFGAISFFLSWFGARMMLQRTIRVFGRKNWTGWALCVAALAVFVLGLRYDVLGSQRHVPNPATITEARLTVSNYYSFSEHSIDHLPETPDLLIRDQDELEQLAQANGTFLTEAMKARGTQASESGEPTAQIAIRYRLSSGLTQTRIYEIPKSSDLGRTIAALCRKPEYAAAYYEARWPNDAEEGAFSWYVTPPASAQTEEDMENDYDGSTDIYYDTPDVVRFGSFRLALVRQALIEDAKAGALPISNALTWDDKDLGELSVYPSEYNNLLQVNVPESATHTVAVLSGK